MPKRKAEESMMAHPSIAPDHLVAKRNREAHRKPRPHCPKCGNPMRRTSTLKMCEGCWQDKQRKRGNLPGAA